MNKWPIALRAWLGAAAVGFSVLCSVMNSPQLIAAATVQSRRSLADNTSHEAFMEYIGGGGAALSDVPVLNSSAFDFYFLLAFATDPSATEGNFNATWQPRLSPSNIAAIKALHPTIKFSCSIGGGGSSPSVIFQPSSITTWVQNAVASLSAIISTYQLDGIDIDFESFTTSSEDFATGIGQLITKLKQKNLISFATIAPYPGTDSYYTELWSSYNDTIDYVNYQMYSQGNMSVSEYVTVYANAKSRYSGGTVLASFETVNNGTAIIPSSGLDGCKQLQEMGYFMDGIFIWSADQSYNNFQYEKEAQTLLERAASPSPSPAATPTFGPLQSSPLGQPHGPVASPFSHGTPTTFVSYKRLLYTLLLPIVATPGFFF